MKIFDCWVMGFVLKTSCKKKPLIVFHFWEFQKQQQEDIAVSPQYWARAAASKVVEQQASPKISNFPFWFSQNQKTNSILRKGFEIENSLAVMSPLNGHNKGPYKLLFKNAKPNLHFIFFLRGCWMEVHLVVLLNSKETQDVMLL